METSIPGVVLGVFAHPDDPEVAAGGTLARWARAGAEVHLCVVARGDKGTSDPDADLSALVETRRRETLEAGRVLGVAEHHWLDYPDGQVPDDESLCARLVGLVRRVRPDAVVAPDPTAVFFGQHYVNHRDHLRVGWAMLHALAPASANPHYYPEAGPPHQVALVYLSGTLEPDVWVDVSETIDAKAEAVACHASQVGEPGEWLRTAMRDRAERAGREVAVDFAEAFRRLRLSPN